MPYSFFRRVGKQVNEGIIKDVKARAAILQMKWERAISTKPLLWKPEKKAMIKGLDAKVGKEEGKWKNDEEKIENRCYKHWRELNKEVTW